MHSDAADRGRHRLGPDPRSSTTSCSPSRRRRSSPSTGPSPWPRSTGPAAALAAVDALDLDGYHLFHATRADLLRRLGRHDEAAEAYDAALALATNAAERRFLEDRRRALPG